jgi:beta-N-acetylhexosaminidase
LALRTLLAAFSGTQAPPWALRLVEDGLGGVALFGFNIADPEQVARLTASLRAVRPDIIVATDEEGGDVTRLSYAHGSPYPGNAALGVGNDPALTTRVYQAIGADLAAVGITMDMAPAVDVNSADDNPAIGTRSFGNDANLVAIHAAAAVTGLQRAGVAACAKHFPGHGATVADSHLGLPLVDASMDVLWQRELPPFQAAIKAEVMAVMTAHIRVPAITGSDPATFSPAALSGLLRGELGFAGVIVSDALEMRGASGLIGVPEAAVVSLIAGNDLLCIGGEFPRHPGAQELIEATAQAIVDAVLGGRLAPEALEAAAMRTELLGRFPADTLSSDAGAVEFSEAQSVAAARRAVRIEGVLPAGLAEAVVVQLEPAATLAVGTVPWGLSSVLGGVRVVHSTPAALHWGESGGSGGPVAATEPIDAAGLCAYAGSRPIVVVSRDTHRHPWARDLVEALTAAHPDVVLVEMGWPGAWRPAGLRAYLASYGASRANAWAVAEILRVIQPVRPDLG